MWNSNNLRRNIIYAFGILLAGLMLSGYTFERQYPVDLENYDDSNGINANYGQFRRVAGIYQMHDGIDFRIWYGPVYAVADGNARKVILSDWGNCVIVSTDKNGESFETLYAHLSSFSRSIEALTANDAASTVFVSAGDQLGVSGDSGTASEGQPHLHFGIGPTIGLYTNTEVNPITHGLKIKSDPDHYGAAAFEKPRKGDDNIIFYDSNKVVNNSKPGTALKIITESYQKANYAATPYMIKYKISKGGDPSYENQQDHQKQIKFDDQNMFASDNYVTEGLFKSKFPHNEYTYMDWTPEEEGIYTIEAKVYVASWNGVSPNYPDEFNPERGLTQTISRMIEVRSNLYSMVDPTGMYAWQPSQTAASATGVSAMGTSWPTPKYAEDLSNTIFTTNSIDVDPDFQRYTVFTYSSMRNSDFTIRIKDLDDNERHVLTASGTEGEITWNGSGVSDGTYKYEIEARDQLTGVLSTKEGISFITIDNIKPPIMATTNFPSVRSITQTDEGTAIQFYSDEDLTSCVVNIVNATDHNDYIIEGIGRYPRLAANEAVNLVWDGAGYYGDGSYQFEVVMTDLAGNINKRYSDPIVINVSGDYEPPAVQPTDCIVPPDEIKNLIVGDIAFDESGNKYVVYTNQSKVVKYNDSGQIVGTIESFGGESLWYPLAATISTSGDYIIIAEPFRRRILVFDEDLNSTSKEDRSISAVYMETKYHKTNWFGFHGYGRATQTDRYRDWSTPGFPVDVEIEGDALYVVEQGKNAVYKYELNAMGQIDCSPFYRDVSDYHNLYFFATDDPLLRGDAGKFVGAVGGVVFFGEPFSGTVLLLLGGIFGEDIVVDSVSYRSNTVGNYGPSEEQLASPQAIALGSYGCIYISDTGNNRIQKFAPDGSFLSKFGEELLNSPKGIDVDTYGNVWVADTGNHRIVQFNPSGNYVREYVSDDYEIDPQKLAVKDGKIYIADADHDEPLVWNVGGELSNLRVSNNGWFSPNGDAQEDSLKIFYKLSQPADVAIEAFRESTSEVVSMTSGGDVALASAPRSVGNNEEVWDGSIFPSGATVQSTAESEQNIIEEGRHTLRITAAFGDYLKSASTDITVDTIAPEISFEVAPLVISPNGDGVNDSLEYSYTVSDNLSPTAQIKIFVHKDSKVLDVLRDSPYSLVASLGEGVPAAPSESWNGKINGHVLEGNYTIELRATDLAGNMASVSREVLVDAQPPRIEALSVSNEYFSPNNDGKKDDTEISFNVSDAWTDKMAVTVLVANEYGELVTKVVDRAELVGGGYTYTWEAEGVADGSYKFRIFAEDTAGNIGTAETAAVVDTIPPEIIMFSAEPNPFTPNKDDVNDKTLFSYLFSEVCDADLRILRADNTTLFYEHWENNISQGALIWDGSGFHGGILGESHPYRLYLEDRAGNLTTSEAGLIVVDYLPSLVPYAFADPDPFSPVNPNNSFTDIKYYLSRDDLAVSVKVIGKEGRLVKMLVDDQKQDKGEHSVRWYGDHDSGYDGPTAAADPSKVADGAWQFTVSANAEDGSNPAFTSNTVLVDNVAPNVLAGPVALDVVNRSATLSYSLPESASVDIAIYDSDNNLVAELESGSDLPAGQAGKTPGTHTITWQPVEESKQLTYFKITAIDTALNRAELKTEYFAVDPLEDLQITNVNVSPATFTPNGDGLSDLSRVSYTVSGGASDYNVDIDVQTATGSTIKRLIEDETQTPGNYSFYWYGTNDSGAYPNDGEYKFVITAEDLRGTTIEEEKAVLVVSTRPTVSLSSNLSVFSPNSDGSRDTVIFTYSINYPMEYITDDALAKLEVVNTAGETVWEKTFNHTAGTYSYEYNGEKTGGGMLEAGNYYVRASAEDALGSLAVPQTINLKVDYTEPEPSDFTISPQYAKLNTEVSVNLEFEEDLADDPTVTLTLSNGETRTATLVSSEGHSYSYSYTITAADAEGTTTVTASALDLAYNLITKTSSLVIDMTDPAISDLSVTPNPAGTPEVSGQVSIKFKVSEALGQIPVVYVTQNGAVPQMATVSGDWDQANGQCEAKYSAVTGYDGAALVTIEAADLANNPTTYQPINPLTIDTIAPTFTSINCETANLKDGEYFAKEGTQADIIFTASEDLAFNPDVKVNDNAADYEGEISNEYTYNYTVTSSDTNGNVAISITGYDHAGNEGTIQTSTSSESFIIDLVNPTVTISTDAGMIANPSPFSTNGSSEAGHCQTTLQYTISETGYVTIGIHKIPNTLEDYTKDDFNSDNLVMTYDEDWLTAGIHGRVWNGTIQSNQAAYDTNSNGYADPGKFAFIVEVRDPAGNVIEGKWGGTCWIQDNVLQLEQPDQVEIGGDNPRPQYFSPNDDGNTDSTQIWFRVLLGITPEEPELPERIGILAIPDDFAWVADQKLVGTYTVRVYNEDKSSLVRTIVEDEPLNSNVIISETWDGKNDAAENMPEGTYKIEVDARDYLGGAAENNLLTLTVTVDVTAPTVVSNEPQNPDLTPWRNGSETYTFDVDFSDSHNAYASGLDYAQYKIDSGDWRTIFETAEAAYTDDWGSGIYDQCSPGTNTINVKAFDEAGNETPETLGFYVKKDEDKPLVSDPTSALSITNDSTPAWTWSAGSDATSGIEGYYVRVGTSDGGEDAIAATWIGDVTSWAPSSALADGTYYASIRARDNAGNLSNWSSSSQVQVDTIPPQLTSVYVSPNPISPGTVDGNKDSTTFYYVLSEGSTVSIYVDDVLKFGPTDPGRLNCSTDWAQEDCAYLSEGVHNYYISAVDSAGNVGSSGNKTFTVDNTPPVISNLAFSANPMVWDGINNSSTVTYDISDNISGVLSVEHLLKDPQGRIAWCFDPVTDNQFTWTGGYYWGIPPVGYYKISVIGTDNAGNTSEATGIIRLKSRDEVIFIDENNGGNNGVRTVKVAKDAGSFDASDYWEITETDWFENPTLGDYNGDGYPLFAAINRAGDDNVYVYNPRTQALQYTINSYGTVPNPYHMVSGDFDGDGKDEIAISDDDFWIYMYDPVSRALIKKWRADGKEFAAGDLDGDGKDELAVINSGHDSIYLYDPDEISNGSTGSNQYRAWDVSGEFLQTLTCNDFNGDGVDDIAAAITWDNKVHIYNSSGSLLYNFNVNDSSVNFSYIGSGDFQGDGVYEVAVVSDSSANTWMKIYNPQNGQILSEGYIADKCWRPVGGDVYCTYDGTSAYAMSGLVQAQQSGSFEAPVLTSPANDSDVNNIRPIFQWQQQGGGQGTDYSVQVAKNDAFTMDYQSFTKDGNAGSPDSEDPTLYHYTYAIHEFDPGLDKDTYYWKVTASSTTETATSEVWSFTVVPQMTLTGITNYPNPFNPNKERTKIRYRLGADADSVTIRIYDLAGALVRQFDNCPTEGEGSSVWQKYHDVEWDGRNGRGDMVLNGIYPFEITARSGAGTIRGRGKIAVLK